jgi:hypothetical protein
LEHFADIDKLRSQENYLAFIFQQKAFLGV